jgi:hypothetical protein
MQTLDAGALGGGEAGEILLIVVRMLPNGARGVRGRVDEELVVFFGVVLADPAWRKGARFVFHGAAALRGDAIAGFVRGRGVLGVWRGSVGWGHG